MVIALAYFQYYLTEALRWGLVVLALWALVDSAIRPMAAFTATEKLTKPGWMLISAVSGLVLFFFGFMHIFGLVAAVAIGVYLADVRPAVRGIQRGDSHW